MGLLAGCAVQGPDYKPPEIALPVTLSNDTLPPAAATSTVSIRTLGERWWEVYNDSALNLLIEEALTHNADVHVALARIAEARAQAGVTAADRAPVVYGTLGARRTQSSQVGSNPLPEGTARTQNTYRGTLEASYELDLWGRYQRADEAARAEMNAAEATHRAVRLMLSAQTAQQYFLLRAAERREAILHRWLETRSATTQLLQRRLAAGVITQEILHRDQAEELAVRAQLVEVTRARQQTETALIVLAGRSPRAVVADTLSYALTSEADRDLMPVVPEGLPAELLWRRPDLYAAEQRLIAENARIGSVRAQLFPAVTLTAFLGSESTKLADLFSGPAGIYQFAANLLQPIFNAGRLDHAQHIVQARRDQALAQYQAAVANAFGDVRSALAAQTAARAGRELQQQRMTALRAAYKNMQLRYEGGLTNRLELLDTERQLLQSEMAQVDADLAQRIAVSDLCKALGGGWREEVVR